VKEAISSALAQTVPFDEIIVVDDASSDESAKIIEESIYGRTNILFIRHAHNLGQLAAFESGIMKSNGDFIFFLDADDLYAPNYLETCTTVYNRNRQCRFMFSRKVDFGRHTPLDLFKELGRLPQSEILITDLGFSVVRTLEEKVWIGAPTSCLSMHRSLAKKLFPLPLHEEWRIRADDCIVFGASLAGYQKFRLEHALVGYRIHGSNAWANNKRIEEPNVFFMRELSIIRLFNLLSDRFHLGQNVLDIAEFEFKTIPRPSRSDLLRYLRFVAGHTAKRTSRIRAMGVLFKWYLRSRSHVKTVSKTRS
jgi:glycosyltransferase involved in cell wall biosynthesis